MIKISSAVRVPPLLSPRTASYVAAFVREGDSFDYSKWLQNVREEERRVQQTLVVDKPDELVRTEVGDPSNTIPTTRTPPIPVAIWRSHHKTIDDNPEARFTRRLEKICNVWNDFQSSRARDAVYGYLTSVFAIVEHYKVRRKTSKLVRHAFEFADLPFDKNADTFKAVIRCTCDRGVDNKTISKWARALRYVARFKTPQSQLKMFMKKAGGINACAALYARHFGRGRQCYAR